MKHCTHHDLTGHCEASRVHLTEDYCAFLSWEDLDIVAGALKRLLELKLVELGVVDVLAVLSLSLVVDDMNVTIAFLCHGKVLSNAWSALFSEVGDFAFGGELLLSTAAHQLAYQVILIE